MTAEMFKTWVAESHHDETEICEWNLRFKVLDPVQKTLPIIWRVAIAIRREKHNNGAFVMEKLFTISVADVDNRSCKSDIFKLGLELVGELFGHAGGCAVVYGDQAAADDGFGGGHWGGEIWEFLIIIEIKA